MTTKECMNHLYRLRVFYDLKGSEDPEVQESYAILAEALGMAIEILRSPDRPLTDDEINEMLEAIRNAPATLMPAEPVIRWISVEDRLPEDSDGWVLMTDGKDWYKAPRAWMFRLSGEPGYWIPARHGAGAKITHWMPLPPLPEPPEAAK